MDKELQRVFSLPADGNWLILVGIMKTATVSKVREDLDEVLKWVKSGESVALTKGGETVAKLVPAVDGQGEGTDVDAESGGLPDFRAYQKRVFGDKVAPCSMPILDEPRADRF